MSQIHLSELPACAMLPLFASVNQHSSMVKLYLCSLGRTLILSTGLRIHRWTLNEIRLRQMITS